MKRTKNRSSEINIHKTTIMKKYIIAILTLSLPLIASAQKPSQQNNKRILYMGATAHIGNGETIANSAIGIENGKFKLIANATLIRIDRSAYDTVINISGKHVYPGLIALNTSLGLNEIEAVRATNDYNETGNLNPSVRSVIAYNTDSKVTPTVRSNGILYAQVVPQGGLISGQSSVVSLDGWNYEDAVYKADGAIHLNWPSMRIYKAWWAEPEEKQVQHTGESIQRIHHLFADAKAYASQSGQPEKNLHLESMRGLFNGTKKLFVHCDYIKEIIAAVAFCKENGIKMVLVGGTDAWMATELLKANDVPVVLMGTHNLPSRDDEDVDMPYKLPFLLKQGGVKFAIAAGGFWQVRNLPFQAGTGAGYGLTKEEILTATTLSAAEILDIDKTTGTLQQGKDASMLISNGDIFDMKSNSIEKAILNGREIDLDNVQNQLYNKFMDKYGFDRP